MWYLIRDKIHSKHWSSSSEGKQIVIANVSETMENISKCESMVEVKVEEVEDQEDWDNVKDDANELDEIFIMKDESKENLDVITLESGFKDDETVYKEKGEYCFNDEKESGDLIIENTPTLIVNVMVGRQNDPHFITVSDTSCVTSVEPVILGTRVLEKSVTPCNTSPFHETCDTLNSQYSSMFSSQLPLLEISEISSVGGGNTTDETTINRDSDNQNIDYDLLHGGGSSEFGFEHKVENWLQVKPEGSITKSRSEEWVDFEVYANKSAGLPKSKQNRTLYALLKNLKPQFSNVSTKS